MLPAIADGPLHRDPPPPADRSASHTAIQTGRAVLELEAQALQSAADRLDARFAAAVELLLQCRGCVIVTGIGKAGCVGQKIAATLASTGTPSHFLHAAEALHGDLGRVREQDLVLILSFSGETEEVVRLLACLQSLPCQRMAITGRPDSTLARQAHCTLTLGALAEAPPLGLAPTTSTTLMLALGDALALAVAQQRAFAAEDFAKFHPGGSLGRQLARVEDAMRGLDRCRVATPRCSLRDILVQVGQPGRRSGAILLVDPEGRLTGIFTDSDLARLFEERRDDALDQPISKVMTPSPLRVDQGSRLTAAIQLMADRKISELPVVDRNGKPLGLIDITDVLQPPAPPTASHPVSRPDRVPWGATATAAQPAPTSIPHPWRVFP